MRPLKRRHFIQSAGATLAAIGFSQFDFLQQAQQFDQVNAQAAPRKFALLVGINDYSRSPLSGCLTDVRSMQILLEHRYGFEPKDIKLLTDAQATRQGILSAFETHLIAQAKPGDLVVFHFSGHDSMVLDPSPNPGSIYNNQGVNSTIIPFDVAEGEDNNLRSIMRPNRLTRCSPICNWVRRWCLMVHRCPIAKSNQVVSMHSSLFFHNRPTTCG